MSRENLSSTNKPFTPPSPEALMARYLRRQTEAHSAGLASVDLSSEVELYEAGPVQPIDSKLAWEEALTAARFLRTEAAAWKAPPGWPQLVAGCEPAYDLAFCLGNFPQLVRNLHPLLQAKDLGELRGTARGTLKVPELEEWANDVADKSAYPQVLLAVAGLRLAKQYDLAAELIAKCDAEVPEEWQSLWANEKAALAWHRGDSAEAYRLWKQLPDSVPVLFNRGMAALFLGKADEAKEMLSRVTAELPEPNAWHHLARLYLTLASWKR